MAEIITDGSQKELKKHGSDEFPLLVSYEKLSGYKSGSFLWHWHPEIEITRSALISIPKHQYDSGYGLGLNKWQVYLYIILPQTIRRLLPSAAKLISRR